MCVCVCVCVFVWLLLFLLFSICFSVLFVVGCFLGGVVVFCCFCFVFCCFLFVFCCCCFGGGTRFVFNRKSNDGCSVAPMVDQLLSPQDS